LTRVSFQQSPQGQLTWGVQTAKLTDNDFGLAGSMQDVVITAETVGRTGRSSLNLTYPSQSVSGQMDRAFVTLVRPANECCYRVERAAQIGRPSTPVANGNDRFMGTLRLRRIEPNPYYLPPIVQ
jgi:hypothetical protein